MNQEFKILMADIKSQEKITQKEIAQRLGVTTQYLSDVAGGRVPFNDKLKERIKEAYPNVRHIQTETSPIEIAVMEFMRSHTYTVYDLAKFLGVQVGEVTETIANGFNEDSARLWSEKFGFNMNFLLTGEGSVMKSDYNIIPLLPVSAQAGRLSDFASSVAEYECEKIVAPVKEAEMAIPIIGESMYPELPSGAIVFIKKINEKAFIEWGKPYVLDTSNGAVVKYLAPGNEGCVKCISANQNPMYAPFEIPMSEIFGVYRIVSMLCNK